jgi:hypothetical protein
MEKQEGLYPPPLPPPPQLPASAAAALDRTNNKAVDHTPPATLKCALEYICADTLFTLNEVIHLACGHFICFECLKGSLKSALENAKQRNIMIRCPACIEKSKCCSCPTCLPISLGGASPRVNGSPHIISEEEFKTCLAAKVIDNKFMTDWESVSVRGALEDDPTLKTVYCKCNGVYLVSLNNAMYQEGTCPYNCGHKMCVKVSQAS